MMGSCNISGERQLETEETDSDPPYNIKLLFSCFYFIKKGTSLSARDRYKKIPSVYSC